MSPRDKSQPQPHDQRPERPAEGLRPLLQGHLKSAKHRGRPPARRAEPAAAGNGTAEAGPEPADPKADPDAGTSS